MAEGFRQVDRQKQGQYGGAGGAPNESIQHRKHANRSGCHSCVHLAADKRSLGGERKTRSGHTHRAKSCSSRHTGTRLRLTIRTSFRPSKGGAKPLIGVTFSSTPHVHLYSFLVVCAKVFYL